MAFFVFGKIESKQVENILKLLKFTELNVRLIELSRSSVDNFRKKEPMLVS